jgi:hypothetical protein
MNYPGLQFWRQVGNTVFYPGSVTIGTTLGMIQRRRWFVVSSQELVASSGPGVAIPLDELGHQRESMSAGEVIRHVTPGS